MSTWQDLVTAALIGTERSTVPAVAVPGSPIQAGPGDPAVLLLDRAALLTVARRGGRPADHAQRPPAAEPDSAPVVSAAAAGRLARMLGGQHPELLTEWLAAAVARGRRVPAQLLPALLDRARRMVPADTELRRLAAEAGGSRARWLAGLNPDWKFVLADTLGDDAWRRGTAVQRRGYLTALRGRDPGAARELIADGWAAAGPQERVMFVSAMARGLSLADEPLLEAALDDGNTSVRTMAADVLAALPESALARRMTVRAAGCLSLQQGHRGARLVACPPIQCDAGLRRDGITPGPGAAGGRPAGQANLLFEVLARTPLSTWTAQFGRPAEQILALPSGHWAAALFTGWARAAIAQRDQAWMAALINWALAGGLPGTPAGEQALRDLVRRADPAVLAAPGITVGTVPAERPAARDALTVLRFRCHMLKELTDDDSDR
jgi:Family of unknown function (DUF5691)